VQTSFSFLCQFDLSGGFNFLNEDLLHSQYLITKFSLPGSIFSLDLGGCLALIQEGRELAMALAGEMEISFSPPTRLQNTLSLLGRFSLGSFEGGLFTAFQPITIKAQGDILNAQLSGLSMVSLDYIVGLHRTFSLGVTSSYFIRSDLETYSAYPVSNESSAGYFLGNEFSGRLIWNPVSDLQFNLGGGAFLPALGNVAPRADVLWNVELSAVISLR
jgi:hypothetical protein